MIDVRADAVGRGFGMLASVEDEAFDGEVEGLRAVEREDEMVGVFAIEKLVEGDAAGADQLASFDGFVIGAAAGAGAELRGIAAHGLENSGRLWESGGGVVEIQPPRSWR